MHLKIGKTVAADGIPAKAGFDLPRGAGTSASAKRKAIIPDPRNDENLAVAQTHAAMIRFHNRVRRQPARLASRRAQRFAQARELVTKHYQWMVRTDYLPRICRAQRGRQRLQPTAARCSRSARRRPTCRRCRSSSRSPASGSATR